jgi:hypothetical protein
MMCVWRSLVVMQSLDFGLATLPRIGNAPKGRATLATGTKWYISYQSMVRKIRDDHQVTLVEMRASATNPYPHDIRIVDNLLWRIGNPSRLSSRVGPNNRLETDLRPLANLAGLGRSALTR